MRRLTGKIIGLILGFAFGGPLGAVIGFVIGMIRDFQSTNPRPARQPRVKTRVPFPFAGSDSLQQSTYLIGIIVLSAKLAKSDGRVLREEIDAFRRIFHIPDSEINQIGDLFNQARTTASGFESYAARMAQVFRHNPAVLESVMVGLFQVALADSRKLSAKEDIFLARVGTIFGFSQPDYVRLARRAGITLSDEPARPEIKKDTSYEVLGLKETATAEEIKRAYRALIRKHHPDRVAAQGHSTQDVAKATEKMKNLNVAYDKICKERGLK